MTPLLFTILAQEFPLQLVALMCLSLFAAFAMDALDSGPARTVPLCNVGVWLGWLKKIIREWQGAL